MARLRVVDGVGPALAPEREGCTQLGNARRLIRLHGAELHYVHAWRRWLVWDDARWAPDETGEIVRRAKGAVRSIYAEAAACQDDGARRQLAAWAKQSESEAQIRGMIELAKTEPDVPVRPEDLDTDPWLLATRSGTIDLRTGKLRPADRADLLTKLAPVDFDEGAASALWLAFLERVLPDPDVRAFVQRACGYSLTGETREQVLFILWGGGANGKTTLIEILLSALGDYAMRTPADTLLSKRDTAIPNDVARLRGARFVAAAETEEGRRLAEVRVKELTGSDTVSARFMRGEWFDFRPVAKLWISTNHRPTVRGNDEGIWRRIRLVPFTVTIPESERDHTLLERLRDQLAGVLAWAVKGCLEWQCDGLRPPDAVLNATRGYREEQDILGAFLADRCIVAPGCWSTSAGLYASYREWAQGAGERAISAKAFGLILQERGFESARLGHDRKRGWWGVGLSETHSCGREDA